MRQPSAAALVKTTADTHNAVNTIVMTYLINVFFLFLIMLQNRKFGENSPRAILIVPMAGFLLPISLTYNTICVVL